MLNAYQVAEVFERLKAANPNPQPELYYTNPFTLLVAVILSAQATDKGVNKATEGLFKKVQHPQDIVDMGEDKLREHVKTLGFFNAKARHVYAMSHMLCNRFGGQVPENRADLESLPGVGRKTANVVLNTAFGQPTMAVDTHIFRVSQRIGLAQGKTPLDIELQLLKVIPERFLKDAHHWLILLGRYICKARKPECFKCPIHDVCLYPNKTAF